MSLKCGETVAGKRSATCKAKENDLKVPNEK